MHISEINIFDVPPLEGIDIICDERVNLFIGPNATGKSTILRAVKELHSSAIEGSVTHIEDPRGGGVSSDEDGSSFIANIVSIRPSDNWTRGPSGSWETLWDTVPFLYIPATRISLSGRHIFGSKIEEPEHIDTDVLRREFTAESESGYKVDIKGFLRHALNAESGTFDGRTLKSAIGNLSVFMSIVGLSQGLRNQFEKAIQAGYDCASRICKEVVAGFAPHPYVNWEEPVTHYYMGVRTNDRTPEPLYTGDLSSGTQGTLLWIYALALQMASHYNWVEGWEKKPAILLIDEIENHLHPTWQRRVIPALLEHFPGLQIFATTHSPFVVAGLKAGQVHLLKRDENGVVTATPNEQDIVGWTADEILRNLMGVEDPTDQDTAEAARELRQLRSEEPRSDPAEEEKRQKRMQELRKRVDRDLLAGGPAAAQRELFEQQFAEAIRKYKESRDLNQENR